MFKFVGFFACIVYVSAGLLPVEHHEFHHGLSFPSSHEAIFDQSHHGHGSFESSHGAFISHSPIAVSAPATIKVATPVVKYVSQPIVKVSHEPSIIFKSYEPQHHNHESFGHLQKVTYKVAPFAHHEHIETAPAHHSSSILLSAPVYHQATLPLSNHHGHHHQFLH